MTASHPGVDISTCTVDTCPVDYSYLGYQPNKAANIAFAAIFALAFLIFLIQCIRARMFSFLMFMGVGVAVECVGYVGRVMLANNPFNALGFKIEIICLTFAPAFMAGAIYLTLKHIVIAFGAEFSRIKPKWYTWIFVFCDIFSIVVQALGGVAAAIWSDKDPSQLPTANDIMIGGVSFQVFTLSIFGLMALEYGIRCIKFSNQLNPQTLGIRRSMRFKGFLCAFVLSYFAMQVRCIYRLVEMGAGYGSSLNTNETLLYILDTMMCIIIVLCYIVFFPSFLFNIEKSAAKYQYASPNTTDLEDLGPYRNPKNNF